MAGWGRTLVAIAVVERFKQGLMYGLSAGTKKVAVVERWPLVEVRLYRKLEKKGDPKFRNDGNSKLYEHVIGHRTLSKPRDRIDS